MFTVFIIMFVIRVGLFLNEIIKCYLYVIYVSLSLSKKRIFLYASLILTMQKTFKNILIHLKKKVHFI